MAAPEENPNYDAVVRLDRIRYASDDGAFVVAYGSLDDGSEIALVGPIGHLEVGEQARIEGEFAVHPKYGPQIKVSAAEPVDPVNREGVLRYLRTIPGIGAKRALRLYEAHGEETFEAIDADPAAAFEGLGGIGVERIAAAVEAWRSRRGQRRIYSLLAPHGLARFAAELIAWHGAEAEHRLRANPYELTTLHGVGFMSADRVALGLGIERDSPQRIEAAAVHALAEGERSGHTHLPINELLLQTRRLVAIAVEEEMLRSLIERSPVTVRDGSRVYRALTLAREEELAAALRALAASKPSLSWSIERPEDEAAADDQGNDEGAGVVDDAGADLAQDVGEAEADAKAGAGDELTEAQQQGIENALKAPLSVITGGPGTGKTHLTRRLSQLTAAASIRMLPVAPTGRAARRLGEATEDFEAMTVHRALEWIPGMAPRRDESDPIEADLVVVDESSMLSLEIAHQLLLAIGPETHLVLIGDADQLPPVGPGMPFRELIDSEIVPVVRLDHVFRQARRSMIVGAAHAVRTGSVPRGEPGPDEDQDLFLHRRRSPADLAEDVVKIATVRIPERYGLDPVREVAVLAPQYRGPLGIDALHTALRDVHCARASPACNDRFRIGEKLIATRGMPESGITNGTVLILDADDADAEILYLETDYGEIIEIDYGDADALRGGFCTSVHKAQGFEIEAVVVCLHSTHARPLLSRNLLYTAITRARSLCVIAGDDRGLARAVKNTTALDRNSALAERLREPPT